MKKGMIILLFFTLVVSSYAFTEHYFTFQVSNETLIPKISNTVSIDNVKGNQVWAYANDVELRDFMKFGISYQELDHPSSLYQAIMAETKEEMRDWDYYPTYNAYLDIMQEFAEEYPELCQVYTIGNTVEGREIVVAEISDNVGTEENEPEFFYTATMHGDETVGYILMMRLIDYLLSNYGEIDRVTNMINNMEIYINPLSNPDGTFAGGNNTVNGATRYNANGVDLNRNFIDFDDGEHPDGNPWQPENIVMMDFAEEHHFVMSANIHSGAEVVNYPWDTISDRHPDDTWWQLVSHRYADEAQANSPNGYMEGFDDGITNGYDWYTTSGNRQDYMNYYHHCKEFTLELSDVKLLPENQLNAHWNYNKESLLTYMEECLYGIHGLVSNESGDPIDAEITILDHDELNSNAITDEIVGDYHRPIEPGNWDVEVSAYGYITQVFNNISTEDQETVVLNVTLQAQGSVSVTGLVYNADTQTPIENASVELLETPLDQVYTDENGEFVIENVLEDIYTISIFKEGYAAYSEEINVQTGSTYFEFGLYESNAIGFENGQFPPDWSFGGSADWVISTDQAYSGSHSAKSGTISHNQESEVSISVDVSSSSQISFWLRVSSESSYDFLKFYIDGSERDAWSGEENWQSVSYNVSSGEHTFSWIYEKDGSVSSGNDCAWIDDVVLPPIAGNDPELVVNPTEIDIEMSTNQTESQTLMLENIGGGTIQFTIEIDPEVPWVQLDTYSGEIEAAEQEEIELLFDSSDLAENTYNCNLMIYDNREDTTVPITLNVIDNSNSDYEITPATTELLGNYPNPFNPSTAIQFALREAGEASINIYNLKGQRIKTIKNRYQQPGIYQIKWNGTDDSNKKVSSGIFLYKLQANSVNQTKKMLLLE